MVSITGAISAFAVSSGSCFAAGWTGAISGATGLSMAGADRELVSLLVVAVRTGAAGCTDRSGSLTATRGAMTAAATAVAAGAATTAATGATVGAGFSAEGVTGLAGIGVGRRSSATGKGAGWGRAGDAALTGSAANGRATGASTGAFTSVTGRAVIADGGASEARGTGAAVFTTLDWSSSAWGRTAWALR